MANCTEPYPRVANSEMIEITNYTVEYNCLPGFVLTGNKLISCSLTSGQWETPPACSVIRQWDEVHIFPEWWLIVVAVVLAILALSCLLCLCCYYFCGRENAVHPYPGHNNGCCGSRGRCCGVEGNGGGGSDNMRKRDGPDGVYFIPVNKGSFVPCLNASCYYYSSSNHTPAEGKADSSCSCHRSSCSEEGLLTSSRKMSIISSFACRGLEPRDSKASIFEALGNADFSRAQRKAKVPGKTWMPHVQPVRQINTSTK